MKFILSYIVIAFLAFTKDLKTASADNLRAPEAEGPTQTDSLGRDTILMNDKPAQRKLKKKGEKGNKGAGDPDVCSAVFMVLSGDEECIIAADLIKGFKLVGVTLSPEEAEIMMSLLDPPSPSDDDSCIDLEEFTPMCELSLIGIPYHGGRGFNPGSTLGEREISQLQENLEASLWLYREGNLPGSFLLFTFAMLTDNTVLSVISTGLFH